MKKSLTSLAAIAALASTGAMATASAIDHAVRSMAPARGFIRRSGASRSYKRVGDGFRYPEQSSRQALRRFRRAQGGPGLVLSSLTNKYHPSLSNLPF